MAHRTLPLERSIAKMPLPRLSQSPYPIAVGRADRQVGEVVPRAHEADPLLVAVDLHPVDVHLAPGVSQVGGLGRRGRDLPLVDGTCRVRDVEGPDSRSSTGTIRRVVVVDEIRVAGRRRAPEVARGAAPLAEDQQGLPVACRLCRAVARAQPHVGHTDGAVDEVLVRKPRRVRLVGDVLELGAQIRRDEAPDLGPVRRPEGVELAVVGPGDNGPLAVGRRAERCWCGARRRRWRRRGCP